MNAAHRRSDMVTSAATRAMLHRGLQYRELSTTRHSALPIGLRITGRGMMSGHRDARRPRSGLASQARRPPTLAWHQERRSAAAITERDIRRQRPLSNPGGDLPKPYAAIDPPLLQEERKARPEASSGTAIIWVARLFLVTLIIPWIIEIGPLRLSVTRLLLIVTAIPCLILWASGHAGKIRVPDFLVLAFCFWCFVSLMVVHGVGSGLQSAGIISVETIGAYFLARVCIKTRRDFIAMVRTMFWIILFILPFSIYESVTGRNLLLSLFGLVLPTQMDYFMAPRWGLRRVQSVFDHPILSGVFCSSIFAMVHLTLGRTGSVARRWTRSAAVFGATFLSMSSGPLSGLFMQALLLSWDWLLRKVSYRWWIIVALLSALYIAVSLGSNQSVFEFYVHYFAFSRDTGWDRIRIWHYGWISVFEHPFFGIGLNEYQRPEWMEPSIDMFWLVNFVCFGYPGGLIMFSVFWWIFIGTACAKGLDAETRVHRTGYLISLIGIFVVGWTVHFWNAPYLAVMFWLGAGAWIIDSPGLKNAGGRYGSRLAPASQ